MKVEERLRSILDAVRFLEWDIERIESCIGLMKDDPALIKDQIMLLQQELRREEEDRWGEKK